MSGALLAMMGGGIQRQVAVTIGSVTIGVSNFYGYMTGALYAFLNASGPQSVGSASPSTFKGQTVSGIYLSETPAVIVYIGASVGAGFVSAVILEDGNGVNRYIPLTYGSTSGGFSSYTSASLGAQYWAGADATEVRAVQLIG